MLQNHLLYQEVLDMYPDLDLPSLYKQLEPDQAVELTYFLLAGNDPRAIEWLRTITLQPALFHFLSPREIALDLFKQQTPEWFREQERIFEQVYAKTLPQYNGATDIEVRDTLMGLIHYVGAGIGFRFFQNTLKKRGLNPHEETDFFLLWIKLYEAERFEEIETYFNKIPMGSNPYRIPIALCLYEKKDPSKGLSALAYLEYNNIKREDIDNEIPWLINYLSIYIKKSLFFLLQNRREINYAELKHLIREVLRAEWLGKLITDALADASLEQLAKQFSDFEKGDNSGLVKAASAEALDEMILND